MKTRTLIIISIVIAILLDVSWHQTWLLRIINLAPAVMFAAWAFWYRGYTTNGVWIILFGSLTYGLAAYVNPFLLIVSWLLTIFTFKFIYRWAGDNWWLFLGFFNFCGLSLSLVNGNWQLGTHILYAGINTVLSLAIWVVYQRVLPNAQQTLKYR